MKFDWNSGALADGLRCYRGQEFFEAHEHWESVWRECQEPEKTFLQALIQIAAAFHHYKRNNLRGATSMLKGALRRLHPYPELFGGVQVSPLREGIEIWLQMLDEPNPAPRHPFIQIQIDSASAEQP